jgi:hypothetical protein
LNEGQRTALRNLALKKAGAEVDWITIADARALTELGLAERNRSGWQITPEGEALLEAGKTDDPANEPNNVSPINGSITPSGD